MEKWGTKVFLTLPFKTVKAEKKLNEEIHCDTHFSLTLWRVKQRHTVSARSVNRGEIAQYSQQTRGRDPSSKHVNKEWEGWESGTGSELASCKRRVIKTNKPFCDGHDNSLLHLWKKDAFFLIIQFISDLAWLFCWFHHLTKLGIHRNFSRWKWHSVFGRKIKNSQKYEPKIYAAPHASRYRYYCN